MSQIWSADEGQSAAAGGRCEPMASWGQSPSLSVASSTQQHSSTPSASYPSSLANTTSSCMVARRLGHGSSIGMRSPDSGSPFSSSGGGGGGVFQPRVRLSPALERVMMDESERMASRAISPKPFVPHVDIENLGSSSGGGGGGHYRTLSPSPGHSPPSDASPYAYGHSSGRHAHALPDFFPSPVTRDFDQIDALMESVPAAVSTTSSVARLRGGGAASPSSMMAAAAAAAVAGRSRFAALGASFAESPSNASSRREGGGGGGGGGFSFASYADEADEPSPTYQQLHQMTSPDAPVMHSRRLGAAAAAAAAGRSSKCASPALSYSSGPSTRSTSFTPSVSTRSFHSNSTSNSNSNSNAHMLLDTPATAMRGLSIHR